jgi:hypothetical protein
MSYGVDAGGDGATADDEICRGGEAHCRAPLSITARRSSRRPNAYHAAGPKPLGARAGAGRRVRS